MLCATSTLQKLDLGGNDMGSQVGPLLVRSHVLGGNSVAMLDTLCMDLGAVPPPAPCTRKSWATTKLPKCLCCVGEPVWQASGTIQSCPAVWCSLPLSPVHYWRAAAARASSGWLANRPRLMLVHPPSLNSVRAQAGMAVAPDIGFQFSPGLVVSSRAQPAQTSLNPKTLFPPLGMLVKLRGVAQTSLPQDDQQNLGFRTRP